jgi:NAD(P)-dependent dehydrogenase (short-subunit alcohol dehydrogenase family)
MTAPTRPLAGAVAIVTGAGSGLGRSHALALADRGANLVVNDLPSAVDATLTLVAEIQDRGGRAVPVFASAADPASGEQLVRGALDAFGRLDIVVSNAGVLRSDVFPDVDDDNWELHQSVHADGAFRLLRAAWPTLTSQGYGRVVLTTSAAGLFGANGLTSYGASKMAVVGLLRVLAAEAASTDIRVNAVAPLAWTPMSQAGGRVGSTAQFLGSERFSQFAPEHISEVVVLLSRPDCPARGKILTVGGGRVAEVLVGETLGYQGEPLTSEEMLERWDEITDRANVLYPTTLREELAAFVWE